MESQRVHLYRQVMLKIGVGDRGADINKIMERNGILYTTLYLKVSHITIYLLIIQEVDCILKYNGANAACLSPLRR